MLTKRQFNTNYISALIIALIGAYAVLQGRDYDMGSLRSMGPGYFPVIVGCGMIGLAVLMGLSAATGIGSDGGHGAARPAEWRGWLCILAGPLLFILAGKYLGLAVATFACVFAAAMGDKTATLKGSAVLALGITALGVIIFGYMLQVPFPLYPWSDA